jgi:hypothetical protein
MTIHNTVKNNEYDLVVKPLIRWFKNQKADWKLSFPDYHTAATGWDLEACRKNQDLLIEAKYIKGPFLSSFSGMVCSVLANRPQKSMKTKYRGWSHGICWAIGSAYESRSIYQILFDYMARNYDFWVFYGEYFKMKYVFFVNGGKVTKVSWKKILDTTARYSELLPGINAPLKIRRQIVDKLILGI